MISAAGAQLIRITGFTKSADFPMNYILSFEFPNSRYLMVEAIANGVQQDKIHFQLPSWRPGRYELANFAKNVRHFRAFDGEGKILPVTKLTKDRWEVTSKGVAEVHVKYEFFASELNAGSTWLD